MIHQIVNINEFRIEFDYAVEKDLKSFKEEVLQTIHAQYIMNGNMPLLYSGGMDSTFMLRTLLELGIKPDLRTITFSSNRDDYECELTKKRCRQYGLKLPEYVYIDYDAIMEHSYNLIMERDIAYPFIHGYYIQYLLDIFKHEKFFSGMGSEFKLYDNQIKFMYPPKLVMQHNPDRLFEFSTSRTFLSYINDPVFTNNYKKPVPENHRKDLYIRDQIYTNCYPDIFLEHKRGPDDTRVAESMISQIMPLAFAKKPWLPLTKNYFFNVDDYFKRKKERNVN